MICFQTFIPKIFTWCCKKHRIAWAWYYNYIIFHLYSGEESDIWVLENAARQKICFIAEFRFPLFSTNLKRRKFVFGFLEKAEEVFHNWWWPLKKLSESHLDITTASFEYCWTKLFEKDYSFGKRLKILQHVLLPPIWSSNEYPKILSSRDGWLLTASLK